MDPEQLEIVQRYLAGELDVESAALAIHARGAYGFAYSPAHDGPQHLERIHELFGRLLWVALRDKDPENAPNRPFGAAEFRDFSEGRWDDDDSPDKA